MKIGAFIEKKRDGGEHDKASLKVWLDAYLRGDVKDYQMSAWLMAIFFRGLSEAETIAWTDLMWKSGKSMERVGDAYRVDKHSTGGVGDKPSLILVPWVMATAEKYLGRDKVHLPMVSGRGLGFTGGTLDKLESVPGFSPAISTERSKELLREQGFFMMGQTPELAPADRHLYALRDVTGTVDCAPLIISSIMSKKLAETLDGLVLDVKTGRGALMKERADSEALARGLVKVAQSEGVAACALITPMDEPLGFAVGNLLEVIECEDFLSGKRREPGLYEVTLELAARMLAFAAKKKFSLAECRDWCVKELGSARTLEIYRAMYERQGGKWDEYLAAKTKLASDVKRTTSLSPSDGYLRETDALKVAHFVNHLGGGRQRKEDAIDPLVGVELHKKVGDRVEKGTPLATWYHRSTVSEAEVAGAAKEIFVVGDVAVDTKEWILKVIE